MKTEWVILLLDEDEQVEMESKPYPSRRKAVQVKEHLRATCGWRWELVDRVSYMHDEQDNDK